MATNSKGVFPGCKRTVQQMLTQEVVGDAHGRIVNITSQHGIVCSPAKFAYGVGKASAVYMTRRVAVGYAVSVFRSVRPATAASLHPRDEHR